MRIENGTTIHRIWGTLEDAELIALVEYHGFAEKICRSLIEEQPEGCALIWIDHYTGKMNIVRKAASPSSEASHV